MSVQLREQLRIDAEQTEVPVDAFSGRNSLPGIRRCSTSQSPGGKNMSWLIGIT